MSRDDFPLVKAAFKTGPFETIGGWAHAIPPEARAEIRELIAAHASLRRKVARLSLELANERVTNGETGGDHG